MEITERTRVSGEFLVQSEAELNTNAQVPMVCTSVPGCLLTYVGTFGRSEVEQSNLKNVLVCLSEHTVDHTINVLLNQNNAQKQA